MIRPAVPVRPTGSESPSAGWERRVLLIDRAGMDALIVPRLLDCIEGTSHEVTRVSGVGDAVRTLEHETFDVALLDCDGSAASITCVSSLHSAAPSLPIVVLSRGGDNDVALRAVQAGAQDYLDKQRLDAGALAQAIRHAIERKRSEARLVYLAHYDQLTGLVNRSLFQDRLVQALERASKERTRVALLFLDLDRFKEINDTWGHDVGDVLLEQVGARLRSCVRGNETVARIGGDEFTIILDGIRRLDDATTVAKRILDAFEEPFDLEGRPTVVSTSIGVAISSESGATLEEMLERADRAMYRAKKSGRRAYDVYQDEPDITTGDLFDTNCEVERALANDELMLLYQPKVDVDTGRIVGMEALLRWNHPRFGMMAPGEFIHAMEGAGVINAVGDWVLESAMRQMKQWLDEGRGDFRMAVNVSPQQLEDPGFVDNLRRLLDLTKLPARNLELEITESVLIEHSVKSLSLIDAVQRLGVRLAMDDFGTGYASLAYLVNYPIHTLKIDKSFVGDLTRSTKHRAIVTAVVGLGRSLGLEVVAEGVETLAQLEALRGLGCQCIQGHLLSTPSSADQIGTWLSEH